MDLIIQALIYYFNQAILVQNSKLISIKSIKYGDPILIADSDLPSIIVGPGSTNYTSKGTRYDEKKHQVIIKLVFDIKDTFSENPDPNKVLSIESVIKMIEDSNVLQENNPTTICGIIQDNPQLLLNGNPTCDFVKIISVNYGDLVNGGGTTYEVSILIEATVVANK